MYNDDQPRKKALVDALGGADDPSPLGMPGSVGNPNTGIGGAVSAPPLQADAPAPIAPPKPSAFQSGNASVSGYLTDAMNAFAPKIRGIADEAGRKSALNSYLQEISPEVQKRGGNISNIGNSDKATVNGRTIDFFGDIEGAATPQYLDVTDQANAPQGGGMFAGSSISPMLQGDASAGIQSALQNIGGINDNTRLQELIKALGGQV
jgi:hypothetical protein